MTERAAKAVADALRNRAVKNHHLTDADKAQAAGFEVHYTTFIVEDGEEAKDFYKPVAEALTKYSVDLADGHFLAFAEPRIDGNPLHQMLNVREGNVVIRGYMTPNDGGHIVTLSMMTLRNAG